MLGGLTELLNVLRLGSFSRRLQKGSQEVKSNGISSRSGRQELQGSISRSERGAIVIC